MLAETLEQVLRGLGSRERAIVELSLQGHTVPEIAARLGCSERRHEGAIHLSGEWPGRLGFAP